MKVYIIIDYNYDADPIILGVFLNIEDAKRLRQKERFSAEIEEYELIE